MDYWNSKYYMYEESQVNFPVISDIDYPKK